MNFYKYIGVVPDLFQLQYLDTGLVQKQSHNQFPLDIYSYGRKAVHEDVWDAVTSKCRGIVVNRETGQIIARPFEKFHNHGSPQAGNLYNPVTEEQLKTQPVIWEKLDGFMCTMYRWGGIDYVASKGSFHSVHAKWATAWYRRTIGQRGNWPMGYTPVFEGLNRDLRIVVDYGDRQELVLLALINRETGEELSALSLETWAKLNHVTTPHVIDMTLERAREESFKTYANDGMGTDEGYVLTWYKVGGAPSRLKMKFVEYLRLHRMVCGVTPWRIWEAMSQGNLTQLKEWTATQDHLPWFQKFVDKWTRVMTKEYQEHYGTSLVIFHTTCQKLGVRPGPRISNIRELSPAQASVRKAFALEFTKPENQKYSAVLFKLLDRTDPAGVIWKYVEGVTAHGHPLRDAQFS